MAPEKVPRGLPQIFQNLLPVKRHFGKENLGRTPCLCYRLGRGKCGGGRIGTSLLYQGSSRAFLGKATAELGPEGQIRMMRQREWR